MLSLEEMRRMLRKKCATSAGEDGEKYAIKWLKNSKWKFECIDQGIGNLSKSLQIDDIFIFFSAQLKNSNVKNPFDVTTDFNIKTDLDIKFPDSKKSAGIQLADVLAGYISRYVMEYLYDESLKDDLYHDIFSKLIACYDSGKNFGVNFVLPINRRNKIFKKFGL